MELHTFLAILPENIMAELKNWASDAQNYAHKGQDPEELILQWAKLTILRNEEFTIQTKDWKRAEYEAME